MVNAQEWLDENYPKKERKEIKELDISSKHLQGDLDLSDFVGLEDLNCSYNEIANLDLSTCSQLSGLSCCVNSLENTNFLTKLPDPKKLTYLDMGDNNFSEQNLSFLEPFVNLKKLHLWTIRQDKIDQGIYNRFTGSLEPLKNANKLEVLSISNTDIDSGLSCLSNSIIDLHCSANKKKDAKVKKIYRTLKGKTFPQWKEDWKKEINDLLGKSPTIQKDIDRFFGGYDKKEIQELKNPDQLGKYKYFIRVPQWGGRIASVVGGSLLLVGAREGNDQYTQAGGIIAIIAPFIEAVSAYAEKKYYDANEGKWDRFVVDAKKLWNDYQELVDGLEILETFYGDSAKECWNSIKELEEKLSKEENEREKQRRFFSNTSKEVEEQKIKDIEENLVNNKAKSEAKYYDLWLLRKEIQEVTKFKETTTKNKFVQDLQKNWEDRKEQWEKIGDKLVGLSKKYNQESTSTNISERKRLENKPAERIVKNVPPQEMLLTRELISRLSKEVVIDFEEDFEKAKLNKQLEIKKQKIEKLQEEVVELQAQIQQNYPFKVN